MLDNPVYVEVSVPIFSYASFTYKIPSSKLENLKDKTLIGRRVLIPFKNTGLTGIILKKADIKPDFDVKEIIDIPDKEPVFTKDYIEIFTKISEYYAYPLGLILHYAMPEGLRWELNKKTGNWINKAEEKPFFVPNIATDVGIPKLSEKAKKLLEFILEKGEVSKEEIKEAGFSLNTLKTLLKKNLIKKEHIWLNKYIKSPNKNYNFKDIYTDEGAYLFFSKKAEDRLKTYLQIINSNIKRKKSTVLVFPNIKTVEKVFRYIQDYFGEKTFLYCDVIPNKEKVKNWFYLKNYKGCVVVGTYSSLFIPVKDLKTIIIEDEYSESYKIKRAPKVDIRRLAYEIHRKTKASLILSASVPSVESIYSVQRNIMLPFWKNISLIKNKKAKIRILGFSSIKDIERKVLNEIGIGKKILLIGNKKGFSSFLYCKVCEEEILCNQCDVPVRVYKDNENFSLKCDICGKKYVFIEHCPKCDFPLEKVGFGTEKIESILKENNIDFSYVGEGKETQVKLSVSISGKEILVKDFDKVININPDFYLTIPDFKGEEKFFRNIVIPYLKTKEEYILITNTEKSVPVEALKEGDIFRFYNYELENRKKWEYPPFSKIYLFTFENKNLNIQIVKQIFEKAIKESKAEEIYYEGPFYSQISKVRGKVRIQIVVKNLKEKHIIKALYEISKKKKINLTVEIL